MEFDAGAAVRAAKKAARSSGGSAFQHLMVQMVDTLRPRMPDMPPVAVQALLTADAYWQRSHGSAEDLAAASVACWQYLEAKNGSSVVIEDEEDHLLRAVLCVLTVDEDEHWNVDEAAYWFKEFLPTSE